MWDDGRQPTAESQATLTTTRWRVAGASVAGTSHLRGNVPCQDAHLFSDEDGILLVAVADGAGSATRSGEGALRAVSRSLATLKVATATPPQDEAGWRDAMRLAFAEARHALITLAEGEEELLSAFSTTLTCVAVAEGWLAVGQVGDGAAIVQDEVGAYFAAAEPQRGEYANETRFLTSPDALDAVEVRVYAQNIQAVAVTTDGLLKLALKMPDNVPHPPFFEPLLRWVAQTENTAMAEEELSAFLASERVSARTHDDKTLVLATRPRPIP